MACLTLAAGGDRWAGEGAEFWLKPEGPLWHLIVDRRRDIFVVLKPEVADWCWENIGAYRIVEHVPDDGFGPAGEDSWRIEFRSAADRALFAQHWIARPKAKA